MIGNEAFRAATAFVAFAALLAVASADAAPLAYVPNEGAASISVIDTETDKVVSTLKIGKKPRGIAVTADGKRLFVSDQTANALIVFDLDRRAEIARIALG
ncbi:MAG TPA: beta-propeller fold lactonase family protein, partial [Vicinamibacterales bacterium]|nr:beta-propeller fold lactonase family protein [Vicinamibacterales bacterium]